MSDEDLIRLFPNNASIFGKIHLPQRGRLGRRVVSISARLEANLGPNDRMMAYGLEKGM